MTEHEKMLVHDLRHKLLRAGYPEIFIVSMEELEATEKSIEEHLKALSEPLILKCGKYGLYFKGVQLVLEVR